MSSSFYELVCICVIVALRGISTRSTCGDVMVVEFFGNTVMVSNLAGAGDAVISFGQKEHCLYRDVI